MRVILLQDIKGLGKKDDIKEVAEGYARNFLFEKKLAEMATQSSVKKIEAVKKKQVEKEQMDLEKTQELALQLEGRAIMMSVKEKDGKLFGSVQAKDLARELKKEDILIPEKAIILDNPIKEIGEYDVRIELDHGIEASITVVVESAN